MAFYYYGISFLGSIFFAATDGGNRFYEFMSYNVRRLGEVAGGALHDLKLPQTDKECNKK